MEKKALPWEGFLISTIRISSEKYLNMKGYKKWKKRSLFFAGLIILESK